MTVVQCQKQFKMDYFIEMCKQLLICSKILILTVQFAKCVLKLCLWLQIFNAIIRVYIKVFLAFVSAVPVNQLGPCS
jgi:predicted neutral ceramidase superfamily lipid hydrolase